jgi:hypothetical protein
MATASTTELSHPLCVALDLADPSECRRVAAAVAPYAGVLKVGLTAFVAGGPELVHELARLRPVFLDLKLHDIPAQVGGAVARAVRAPAFYGRRINCPTCGPYDVSRVVLDSQLLHRLDRKRRLEVLDRARRNAPPHTRPIITSYLL